MRRVAAIVSTAAVLMWSVGVFAQAKPSFAGKWVREAPAAPATPPAGGGGGGGRQGGGGGGGFGMENTITQDATTLTVDYMQGQNPAKLVFKLDGTESKNPGRGGAEQVSKAVWEGQKLVITTTTPNGDSKRVLSLEGGNLVIETTNPGREGGAPTTSKVVYKKG